MNFDEEMNQFFKSFSPYDRKMVESDPFYKSAVEEQDAVKAANRAIELLPGLGNVKTKREQRAIAKKRKRGDFDEFI